MKEHLQNELEVELSPRMWHALMQALDSNGNGMVDLQELTSFLFYQEHFSAAQDETILRIQSMIPHDVAEDLEKSSHPSISHQFDV